MPRVVAATDKFRGTASASEVALAVARAAAAAGWECDQVPVSDGGEGFADVLGGRSRLVRAHDPLGREIEAEWRLLDDGRTAVVEMALASGLELVGGAQGNDPVAADTTGTGELVAAAVKAGARRILVGAGGSATTDGGLAALEVLEPHSRLRGVELVVACDVLIPFVDAARIFAPQKGASGAQVELLVRRLERLVQLYRDRFGVDVSAIAGSGAAGGLAGGLAAVGATLVPGFEVVAEAVDLVERIDGADLVVTGEGALDEQSFAGKAVGGVVALASELGVPTLVVVGDLVGERPDLGTQIEVLVERFGPVRALADPGGCVQEVVARRLVASRR
ncbi:MAG: glycerate kinase family protein [Acidimicrobiales bacterium]